MTIIEKGRTPLGETIQIEDWSEDLDWMSYGNTIGAYPVARESLPGQFAPKRGRTYRLQLEFKDFEEAQAAYKRLITGEDTLQAYEEANPQ